MKDLKTPAFIYNEDELKRKACIIREIAHEAGASFYYSLKAQCFSEILKILAPLVDGFSCSSPFEAQLAQLVAPELPRFGHQVAIKNAQASTLLGQYDFFSFNSIGQLKSYWQEFGLERTQGRIGLRINPGISWAGDSRYDPGRAYSKLGVSLQELALLTREEDATLNQLGGIHFHSFSELEDFSLFEQIVENLESNCPSLLEKINWINMGGGQLFEEGRNLKRFTEIIRYLQEKYGLMVIVEPGHDVVEGCACLVTQVLDIKVFEDKMVAILDTTVAHMPEVFEYGERPELKEHHSLAPFTYQLAGLSCLAGDIFGDYSFNEPLKIGQTLTFLYTGSYTTVKAQMFNGINLPDIWSFSQKTGPVLRRSYEFSDFYMRNSTCSTFSEARLFESEFPERPA